ncbi:MAG TPA: DHA2 family efflux MFS transporter permease subunit [Roseiflexaceae bacterium]|nr:DHA2 family efflux MFS transporter permease subunit [Roseiflexaceae bacterium]
MSTAESLRSAAIGPAAPRQPAARNFLGLEYKWLVAIAVIFGLFMAVLDTTVVNIALPKLQAVFGATLNDAQWIITGYTLAQTVSIPLFGYLADRFGSKWIYILSLGLFTLASALCGLSWSVNSMIFFRVVQGLGGGALLPIGIAQVYAVFPPEERGLSQSAVGIPVLLAPALGPTLGGYIVQYFDWRLIFYINVPIGIVGVFMCAALLRRGRFNERARLDILGLTLSTLTFASLVYGIGEAASDGWNSSTVIGFSIFGLTCLVLLIIVELRTDDPLLDFSLFKSWNWTSANLITVATTFALFGALFLVPQYLQVLRGLTPIQSGLILLPSSLVTIVVLPISGILVDRFGPKLSILIGLVALGIASYLLSGLTLATPTALIQLWLIGRSVGIGFATQPASVIALSDVPHQKLARGSSFFTVLRLVTSAFVTSFLATYVKNQAIPHYAHLAEQTSFNSPLYGYVLNTLTQAAIQGRWTLPVQAQVLAQVAIRLRLQAAVMAYRDALLLITGFIAVAFVLAFFVGNPRARGGAVME